MKHRNHFKPILLNAIKNGIRESAQNRATNVAKHYLECFWILSNTVK